MTVLCVCEQLTPANTPVRCQCRLATYATRERRACRMEGGRMEVEEEGMAAG